MAVLLEFANVVLRKDVIEQHMPGGVDAVARLGLPNISEDEHLVRVGYMATSEAESLLDRLVAAGLPQALLDVGAVVVQSSDMPPGWLEMGMVDDQAACWLAGESPGRLAPFTHSVLLQLSHASPAAVCSGLRQAGFELASDGRADPDTFTLDRGDAHARVAVISRDGDGVLVLIERELARRAQHAIDSQLIDSLAATLVSLGATPVI